MTTNARQEMFIVGLQALYVAIECDDPKRELLVRINDLSTEYVALRALSPPEPTEGQEEAAITDRDLNVIRTRLSTKNYNGHREDDLIHPRDLEKLFAEIDRLRAPVSLPEPPRRDTDRESLEAMMIRHSFTTENSGSTAGLIEELDAQLAAAPVSLQDGSK